MRIVPEEPDAGTDHGAAENGKLGDLRHALQLEVSGEDGVPTEIGEHSEGSGSDDGTPDSEAIEAVGEIHRVSGADQHQSDKQNKRHEGQRPEIMMREQRVHHQIRPQIFQEWDH